MTMSVQSHAHMVQLQVGHNNYGRSIMPLVRIAQRPEASRPAGYARSYEGMIDLPYIMPSASSSVPYTMCDTR